MLRSLEMVMQGDPAVFEFYRKAAEKWKEIWARKEASEYLELASVLRREEPWFITHCGGEDLGKEIMVVSGFAGMYSTEQGFNGNFEKAELLYSAFRCSFCSGEVLSLATEVARAYGVLQTTLVWSGV